MLCALPFLSQDLLIIGLLELGCDAGISREIRLTESSSLVLSLTFFQELARQEEEENRRKLREQAEKEAREAAERKRQREEEEAAAKARAEKEAEEERRRKRREEMEGELAELEQDDGDHNIESERDSLNRLAGRAKMFGGGSTLRPTENYDSEPDSPMVSTGDRV